MVKYMEKMIKSIILRTLITIVLTLILLILMKASINIKNTIYKYVYDTNFSFTKISNLYNKYFGSLIKMPTYSEQPVFNEYLNYKSKERYFDGVKLEVDNNYLVPISESGLVVFIGEKENYGNVVIIQQVNGIDLWYGNINNINVKLYDYVEKGKMLGEANNYFYLVYKKDGNILNYEEYL